MENHKRHNHRCAQTFLIGAAQSADGSKKQQFWLGTLYQCRVYKGLLSDDKVNDYIEKGW